MLRSRMRLAALLLPPSLAACASAAPPIAASPDDAPPVRTRSVVAVGRDLVALEHTPSGARRVQIAMSPDRAWALLPDVYEGLELPIGVVQPDTRELGTGTFRVQNRIVGTRLSVFIDCGAANVTGIRAADSYTVQLQIVSRVQPGPDSGSTILGTTVVASGRPVTVSSAPVNCPSSGALERRIAVALQARGVTAP